MPAPHVSVAHWNRPKLPTASQVSTVGVVALQRLAPLVHCGGAEQAVAGSAQVWVPPGRRFIALEPMTAPTNALVERNAPMVRPGDVFRARFRLSFRAGS